MKHIKFPIMIFMLVLLLGAGSNTTIRAQDIQSAAALGFSPDGVLFVGDNVGGAVYAFEGSAIHVMLFQDCSGK